MQPNPDMGMDCILLKVAGKRHDVAIVIDGRVGHVKFIVGGRQRRKRLLRVDNGGVVIVVGFAGNVNDDIDG